ncbi:hypothetical protein BDB01DRAFT_833945 [Pilobolus umbonatus]|nr:hypothetical protein BDB01DRAFT_833945 [Pilobolus umbonatus]
MSATHLLKKRWILVDFDQTITINDTIKYLGQMGNQSKKPVWSYYVERYLEDYSIHEAKLAVQSTASDFPNTDFGAFIQQLDSYQPVERNSLARVSEHKVFKGLTRSELTEAGKTMSRTELRLDVLSVLKKYDKDQIRIVSFNWSKDWILGFLSPLKLTYHHIHSNDLVFDQHGVCTGEIIPQLLTTSDKQHVIDTLVSSGYSSFVYIGDSLGDILPLVKAEVGIIIGRNSSLLSTLKMYGFSIDQKRLFQVDDWRQIEAILDKLHCNRV